ncbi:septum formation inhibitor Maf [Roseateles chitinivorans]|uniref:dTTP/UTP pyrophosphatase n=1 Tax=Roseateles chitinivorans TaxID=2917965 RepID=A0A2G9CCN0_9BURK|nr:Maf family protein [Roseateles chitinivorans]PIM54145.1 septum formation inhibitor Maf [Roseateles chitinivorans]
MTVAADFLYLASQSPRRRQLLEQIGVRHELLLPGPDEDAEALEALVAGESPDDYVTRVTAAKLQAALHRRAARGLAPAPVLCSDTTVALGALILGKPDDADHAATMLASLSGRTHRVLTAVALGLPDGRVLSDVNVSQVRFAEIGQARLRAYVASGEPMGKAGAYAIQSQAAAWIEHIAGSYSGIMGLPLFETARLLREGGFDV